MTQQINGIYVAWGKYPYLTPGYNEGSLQSAVIGYLVRLGWLVLRINQGQAVAEYKGKKRIINFVRWYAAGQPQLGKGVTDLQALTKTGQLWAIDLKKPNGCAKPQTLYNQLRPEQLGYLQEVAQRGGVAVVCNNIDALVELISQSKTQA